jgi:hypothetical protein
MPRVRVRQAVGRHAKRRELHEARPIAQKDALPGRLAPRRDVDAIDRAKGRRGIVRAHHQQAAGDPSDRHVLSGQSGNIARPRSIDRIETNRRARTTRGGRRSVRRHHPVRHALRRKRHRASGAGAEIVQEQSERPVRLRGPDDDALAVGKPTRARIHEAVIGKPLRLTGARRQLEVVRRQRAREEDGPPRIGRERERGAGAETDRRRAIGPAQLARAFRAAPLAELRKKDLLAIGRQIHGGTSRRATRDRPSGALAEA